MTNDRKNHIGNVETCSYNAIQQMAPLRATHVLSLTVNEHIIVWEAQTQPEKRLQSYNNFNHTTTSAIIARQLRSGRHIITPFIYCGL